MAGDKVSKNNNSTNQSKKVDAAGKPEFQSITEGSITMKYPADEESTVFYNPVQVQNRDLSILMLTLFSERRAIRQAVLRKKQALRKENQGKSPADRLKPEVIKEQIQEYEASLDPCHVVSEQLPEHGMSVLDALAASGLRSMRYWKEIPGVKHVTINDLEPAAVERAHSNIKGNGLQSVVIEKLQRDDDNNLVWQRPQGIHVQNGDAKMEMYLSQRPQALTTLTNPAIQSSLKPQWDVIDLDPYGSAAPFLDAAVQAIENNGMLCVTCTDMAALGGSHPETCYGRYASMPIPSARYLQEVALRILLCELATTAAKYGRTIHPILSVGMNFYIRVFVEVKDDKAGVNKLSLQIGSVFQSTQCSSFFTVPHGRLGGKKGNVYQPNRAPPVPQCEETGADFKVGGPMWLGPLHDPQVVQTALKRLQGKTSTSSDNSSLRMYPDMKWIATQDRLEGLLTSVHEELNDVPLFYGMPDFSRTLRCSSPPQHIVKAAILNAGYKVSGYHKDPQAIKTNAPNSFMWDILRVWCKENPPAKTPEPDSPAAKILVKVVTSTINFTIPPDLKQQIAANKKKDKKKISRFPMNPQANWGPKKAASGKKRKVDET